MTTAPEGRPPFPPRPMKPLTAALILIISGAMGLLLLATALKTGNPSRMIGFGGGLMCIGMFLFSLPIVRRSYHPLPLILATVAFTASLACFAWVCLVTPEVLPVRGGRRSLNQSVAPVAGFLSAVATVAVPILMTRWLRRLHREQTGPTTTT